MFAYVACYRFLYLPTQITMQLATEISWLFNETIEYILAFLSLGITPIQNWYFVV